MTPNLSGGELAVLGCVWPSLVGVAAGGLGLLTPTMGWWFAFLTLWFLASLPCFVFVVRGLYRSYSRDLHSTSRSILAAVLGVPLACLCIRLGAGVFFVVSSPTRFA